MDIKAGGIYSITNNADGKHTTYIGSTTQTFSHRWMTHRSRLRGNRHCNAYLQCAWDKYGEEAFFFSIVEIVNNNDEMVAKERKWLDFFRMYVPVYNLSLSIGPHGCLGHSMSEEIKEFLRRTRSGENHYMYGKKHSRETKEKISKSLSGEKNPFYGRKHSLESREKMSAANQGENNPWYGKQFPKAMCNNISQGRAKPYPAFRHTVTGEIIPAGKNLWKLSKDKNLHYSGMYWLAHGRQKICKGWILLGDKKC